MTAVAFARHRHGGESRPVSHVVELRPRAAALTALCGRRFPPASLELLPAWTGMPCLSCALRLPTPPAPEPAPVARADPAATEVHGHLRAAAFTGEPLAHLLPEHTPRLCSRGKTVAVSACGHLVDDWTDGATAPPPQDWPVCTECTEVTVLDDASAS